jgi:hypothetical protein
VPLALYLISFILVFARWSDAIHRAVGRFAPVFVLFAALTLLMEATEPYLLIGTLHLAAFFCVCLVCHGELAKDRPPPRFLTGFYFWISVGGVLGGLVNGLVAPVVFCRLGMVEYPLALILAAAVRPRGEAPSDEPPLRAADVALVLVLLALSVGLVFLVPKLVTVPTETGDPKATTAWMLRGGLMFGLPAVAVFALVRRPARFALALAALFVASTFAAGRFGETLHLERNFFGVVRVTRSPDGRFIQLVHGTSVHGQQAVDEQGRPQPLAYYYERGPVGHLFDNLSQRAVPLRRVGVIGLGTGAIAHYAEEGQRWTFFEIDPAVERVAHQYFGFLKHCKGQCEIVLGDARRQLSRCPDESFDLLIIDGFCSDSIPVHLLTQEALALYVRKLTADGVLAIHVSNHHLDLAPLVTRLASRHEPPLEVRYRHDQPWESDRQKGKKESEWVILARSEHAMGPVAWDRYWDMVSPVPGPVWRDDFANVLAVWRRHKED